MGNTAENLAREFKITRSDQDEFSLQSHLKALDAQKNGRFDDEIIPIQLPDKYDQTIMADNGPRKGQTIEALQKLRPYFDRKLGSVTVGSSSQITDGAGACILMREQTAKDRGLTPLGYIKGYAYAGCDPHRMGMGPTYAQWLIRRFGLTMDDFDFEINEAFAAQVYKTAFESPSFAKNELNDDSPLGTLPLEKLNVNGGAIVGAPGSIGDSYLHDIIV